MRLIVASGNAHKIAEIAAMFRSGGLDTLDVVGMKSLGEPPEIVESARDFRGNALLKVQGISRWLAQTGSCGGRTAADDWVLADDSGLCVHALGGRPGVHSARFAGEDATDQENNQRLVEELQTQGLDASPGHYEVVLALGRVCTPLEAPPSIAVDRHKGVLLVSGRCDGEVRCTARGEGGFGYDPHFWVDDGARTFAELSQDQKAPRSHRGQAMRELITLLRRMER